MTSWIKIDNSMPANPKIVMAGDRAAWLAICGICYCNEHLTDGFIAGHVLPVAAPGVKKPETLAAGLVAAGLWRPVEGGWQIHDYGEHQRSAEQVHTQRAKDARRQADKRAASNGSPRGHIADSAPDSTRESLARVCGPARSRPIARGEESREEKKRPTPEVSLISSDADGADVKSSIDRRLCNLLRRRALERNPKFKVKSNARWLNDMRLCRERDGNTEAEITEEIEWVFRDAFWGGVIQSPGNLREHFPQIWDRMKNGTAGPAPSDTVGDWLDDINANKAVIDGEIIEEGGAS